MADDMNDEEEYQFSDAESTDVFSTPAQDLSGQGAEPNLMRRNLLVGVGVIAVILTVYKLLGLFFAPKEPTKAVATPTTVEQPVVQKKVEPIIETPVPTPTPTFTPPAQPTTSKMKSDLEEYVRQQTASNRGDIQRLDASVTNMESQIATINSRLSVLNESITKLATSIDKLEKPPVKQVTKRRKKRITWMPKPRKDVYFLKAVIPGRAWIIAQNGSTLTVSKGARVPGYGIVEAIYPAEGKVVMSTGAVIRFKPAER